MAQISIVPLLRHNKTSTHTIYTLPEDHSGAVGNELGTLTPSPLQFSRTQHERILLRVERQVTATAVRVDLCFHYVSVKGRG